MFSLCGQMWDLNGRLCGRFKGHTGHVRSCVFSRDGDLLATASQDKTAKVHTHTHTDKVIKTCVPISVI